ncbi:glycoside hydrolase family 3 N-terminal domain-containing protein [Bacteroidota bacterium]
MSRSRIKLRTILFELFLAITLWFIIFNNTLNNNENIDFNYLFPLTENDLNWVNETFSKMSLRDKCSQLIISYAPIKDTSKDSEEYKRLIKLVEKFKVGGLILFDGNIRNHVKLINKFQYLSDIPLLISSDFERGAGTRIEEAVEFPHNMALGATYDPYLSYLTGKFTAIAGRSAGVHQNYSPLLDVSHDYKNPIINIRAYSEDPDLIAQHANAFITGLHKGGMIATGKHFPGHGATEIDSHNELPVIRQSEKKFEQIDLVPFSKAISLGIQSIMIGHLEIPTFEEKRGIPATFSYNITHELLRKKMNFSGFIVTDAMNMKAITNNFNQDEAAKLAVQAGADLILFPQDDSSAIEGIYNAVLSEKITESRIDESVKKILIVKKWMELDNYKPIDINEALKYIDKKSHRRLSQEIAERSITLLKDENNLIPISPKKFKNIFCVTLSDTKFRNSLKQDFPFEEFLLNQLDNVNYYRLNLRSKKTHYRKALQIAKKSDLILLPLYINIWNNGNEKLLDDQHLEFIKSLKRLNKPLATINFGNPYLTSTLKDLPVLICTYSNTKVSQGAALDAIIGNVSITGKLPITIPETDFKIGYGLERKLNKIWVQSSDADTSYEFSLIDSIMSAGVKDSVFPGAVLLIGHRNRIIYHKPFGNHTYDTNSVNISRKSIFDLASLTKVIATTSAIMILYDNNKLDLEDKVVEYLPKFANNGKDKITIHHLLTHNSGLPSYKRFYRMYDNKDEIINDLMNIELTFNPGENYSYSDLGMIVLQLIIEKISGLSLDKFLYENLFNKLDMNSTRFNPSKEFKNQCVPTELDNYWRNKLIIGEVHDENSYALGGIAGHAGLFSTAHDLANLTFIYLNNGTYKQKEIFQPNTIELFTNIQSQNGNRSLGWGIISLSGYSSAGTKFSKNSFGHTGYTGTSIWVDKDRGLFVILLTNRVHPSRKNKKIIEFRPKLHDYIVDTTEY